MATVTGRSIPAHLAALVLLGCFGSSQPAPWTGEVLLDGCATWVSEACAVEPGAELRVWAAVPTEATLVVRIAEASTEMRPAPRTGGQLARAAVPAGASEVEVCRRPAGPCWRRELVAATDELAIPAFDDAMALLRSGEDARRAMADTSAEMLRIDRGMEATKLRSILVYLEQHESTMQRQQEHVAFMETAAPPDLVSQGHAAYGRAQLDLRRGRHHDAITSAHRASNLYYAAGRPSAANATLVVELETLFKLGRHAEGLRIAADGVASPGEERCASAFIHTNWGWFHRVATSQGLAMPSTYTELPSPEEAVRLALKLHEGCPNEAMALGNDWINLGFVLADQGRREEAGAAEREATSRWEALTTPQKLGLLELRALLATDPVAATRAWIQLADTLAHTGERWRSRAHLASLLTGDAALDAHDDARNIALEHAWQAPLDLGRESFLGLLRTSTARHARLLGDAGRWTEAFDTARSLNRWVYATTRMTRELADDEDTGRWDTALESYEQQRRVAGQLYDNVWTATDEIGADALREEARQKLREAERTLADRVVSADLELGSPPDPPANTVLLGRIDETHLVAQTSESTTPTTVEAWPSTVAPLLSKRPRLQVLPNDRLGDVHLTTLPTGRLIDEAEVVWSLDLDVPAPSATETRAVVVIDPRGNLPQARTEGAAVARALRARGWTVQVLRGREATRDAVMKAVVGAGLFHVAGHGERGETPLSARLLLAGTDILTTTDVLAMHPPPAHVTLSGCETGRAPAYEGAGLGLAQTFISAGSSSVIATARSIRDADARAFAESLYGADFPTDPAAAFATAVRSTPELVDPGAFRIFVP